MTIFPDAWTTFPSLSWEEAWKVFRSVGWTGAETIEARVHQNTPIHHLLGSIAWNDPHDARPGQPLLHDQTFLGACQTLLDAGLPIEERGHEGSSIFLESAQAPIFYMAFFLSKGANPLAMDKDGNQWPYYLARNLGLFMPHWHAKLSWLKESSLDLTHLNHAGKSLLSVIKNQDIPYLSAPRLAKYKTELVDLLEAAQVFKERQRLSDTLPSSASTKGLKHL